MAPESADTRYIFEDIPTGLVPLVELGRASGVAMPTMRAVADLGCTISGQDFWSQGRSLEKLGLASDALPLGWWVGFQVDPETFAKVKAGLYTMFSIQGKGTLEPLD